MNDACPPDNTLPARHAARLRHYWRSYGWPHYDNIDIDLLRRGLIEEIAPPGIASYFALTAAGRTVLCNRVARNRHARGRHREVTRGVAKHLAESGRLVFTEPSMHTAGARRWQCCKPDVFSLTRGLRADHIAPQVHEVKVSRADLLGELRSGKTARYRELAGELFFVILAGIAEPDEIPSDYGVGVWQPDRGYWLARAAPRCSCTLETRHWMALAKATPFTTETVSAQLVF